MGAYVNPSSLDKVAWLYANSIQESHRPPREHYSLGQNAYWVCLVDNGFFSAAGITYDARELEAFSNPSDTRPKVWFLVPAEKLLPVSDLANYLRN